MNYYSSQFNACANNIKLTDQSLNNLGWQDLPSQKKLDSNPTSVHATTFINPASGVNSVDGDGCVGSVGGSGGIGSVDGARGGNMLKNSDEAESVWPKDENMEIQVRNAQPIDFIFKILAVTGYKKILSTKVC